MPYGLLADGRRLPHAGGIEDKPVALIDLMTEGTRITKPGSVASRFLLEIGAFGPAPLLIVPLKLLVNAGGLTRLAIAVLVWHPARDGQLRWQTPHTALRTIRYGKS
ncbi:hypothetical protein [Paenibacillus sp. GCM10023250]|uniref:hypothetical protein n=1 Tax=Paenibacillus sp. GCM10023250 TaxID=3252648 RepID=UPI00360934EB